MTPTHEHTDQKEHAETMNDDSYQYIDDREGCGLSRPRGPAGVVGERSGDNDTQVTVTCCCCCGALANYCQASCFIAATRNRPGQRAHRPRPTKTTVIGLSPLPGLHRGIDRAFDEGRTWFLVGKGRTTTMLSLSFF